MGALKRMNLVIWISPTCTLDKVDSVELLDPAFFCFLAGSGSGWIQKNKMETAKVQLAYMAASYVR